MEITEVRIKLMESSEDRLRGFCSVTFDKSFVVRDLKIIDGNSGPFVAMPSRKLTASCHNCRTKNHMRANFCNQCGKKLHHNRPQKDSDGRAKLYADIAHPINAACREMIQSRVIEELEKELELAKEPGYRSRYDEGYDSSHSPKKKPSEPAAEKPPVKPPENSSARRDDSHQSPAPSKSGDSKSPKAEKTEQSGDNFGKGVF